MLIQQHADKYEVIATWRLESILLQFDLVWFSEPPGVDDLRKWRNIVFILIVYSGNGYIEGVELDGFLREFVSSTNPDGSPCTQVNLPFFTEHLVPRYTCCYLWDTLCPRKRVVNH